MDPKLRSNSHGTNIFEMLDDNVRENRFTGCLLACIAFVDQFRDDLFRTLRIPLETGQGIEITPQYRLPGGKRPDARIKDRDGRIEVLLETKISTRRTAEQSLSPKGEDTDIYCSPNADQLATYFELGYNENPEGFYLVFLTPDVLEPSEVRTLRKTLESRPEADLEERLKHLSWDVVANIADHSSKCMERDGIDNVSRDFFLIESLRRFLIMENLVQSLVREELELLEALEKDMRNYSGILGEDANLFLLGMRVTQISRKMADVTESAIRGGEKLEPPAVIAQGDHKGFRWLRVFPYEECPVGVCFDFRLNHGEVTVFLTRNEDKLPMNSRFRSKVLSDSEIMENRLRAFMVDGGKYRSYQTAQVDIEGMLRSSHSHVAHLVEYSPAELKRKEISELFYEDYVFGKKLISECLMKPTSGTA